MYCTVSNKQRRAVRYSLLLCTRMSRQCAIRYQWPQALHDSHAKSPTGQLAQQMKHPWHVACDTPWELVLLGQQHFQSHLVRCRINDTQQPAWHKHVRKLPIPFCQNPPPPKSPPPPPKSPPPPPKSTPPPKSPPPPPAQCAVGTLIGRPFGCRYNPCSTPVKLHRFCKGSDTRQ